VSTAIVDIVPAFRKVSTNADHATADNQNRRTNGHACQSPSTIYPVVVSAVLNELARRLPFRVERAAI
jgi:hypothetical protein